MRRAPRPRLARSNRARRWLKRRRERETMRHCFRLCGILAGALAVAWPCHGAHPVDDRIVPVAIVQDRVEMVSPITSDDSATRVSFAETERLDTTEFDESMIRFSAAMRK